MLEKIHKFFDEKKEFKFHFPDEDFIPFAIHYDNKTILTKNSELVQVIKVEGYTYEVDERKFPSLRAEVRRLINKYLPGDFSVWLHTTRKLQDLDFNDEFPTAFSSFSHEMWCKKNYWHDKYVNELYISIVTSSVDYNPNSIDNILKAFSFKKTRDVFDENIKKNHQRLSNIVDNIYKELDHFRPKILQIKEDEKTIYSEILTFFDKICHLNERVMPLPVRDLSTYLNTHKFAFGNNSFEIFDQHGNKKFGVIFTLKNFIDLDIRTLDRFLQLPLSFVITESFTFEKDEETLKDLQYQNYISGIIEDNSFLKETNIADIIKGKNVAINGRKQLSIMFIEDSVDNLNYASYRGYSELVKLGIPIASEDLRLEEIFWSQLPANFNFIKRSYFSCLKDVGSFVSLNNYYIGKLANPWGNPVSILRTSTGVPYFFNFHINKVGHCFFYGNYGSGKTTIINFLLSESMKYEPKIYKIETESKSKAFFKGNGGDYFEKQPKFDQNIKEDLQIKENMYLAEVIESYFRLVSLERYSFYEDNTVKFSKLPENIDQNIINGFKSALVYLNNTNELHDYTCFYINDNVHNSYFIYFLIVYVYAVIKNEQSGKPKVFVLDGLDYIFTETPIINLINNIMQDMGSHSTIMLISTGKNINNEEKVNDLIVKQCDTVIVMADNDITKKDKTLKYEKLLGLDAKAIEMVKELKTVYRQFILIQDDVVTPAELSLSGLKKVTAILSSNEQQNLLVDKLIAEHGNDPINWIDIFAESA